MRYINRELSHILKERVRAELDWLASAESFQRAQIGELPKGCIIERTTDGRKTFALQFRENGKRRYIYMSEADAELYKIALEERKQRIQLLKEIHVYSSHLQSTLSKIETAPGAAVKRMEKQACDSYSSLPYNQKLPKPYPGKEWLTSLPHITDAPPFRAEHLRFQTLGGDKVRSKLEQHLADTLYFYRLEYCYEVALILGGRIVCPDFLVRSPWDGSLIIIECLGLLQDEKYRESWAKKAALYAAHGFQEGKNLICIFDSPENALNTGTVHQILRERLKLWDMQPGIHR